MAKKSKVSLPKDVFNIVGVKGEATVSSFRDEEERVDDLKIQDYRRMVDGDGQVQMLWNAICNTIMSVGVTIDDDTDVDSDEPSEELQFVKDNLTCSAWEGGMSRSLELTNRTMLRAFIEAFRVFEVVYKVGESGKIMIDKLAPRAGKDDNEMKLVIDDHGEFMGFHQMTHFKGKYIDVTVVNNSGISKVVKSTYGEEFGSTYGRSGLKAAWYHYDKAHKGMYLNHVGHELGTVKAKLLKPKINDEDKIANAMSILTRIHMESTISLPPEEMELELLELTDANVMEVGRKMINFHYSTIAKSILAQFIDLGSSVSDTGSRALGDSQVQFFKQGLQTMATILIENPWNQVIADLVRINFNNGIYPTLSVNPIDDVRAVTLLESFMELVRKDTIPDNVKGKILESGADNLGLDITLDEIQEELEADKLQKQETAKMMNSKPQAGNTQVKKDKKVELSDVDKSVTVRDLYPDEEKLKLVDIKRTLDESKAKMESVLGNKLRGQKDGIIDQFIEALRNGRSSIGNVNIELQDGETDYSDELYILSLMLLEFGKVISANEINKSVPNTTKKIRDVIRDMTNMTVEEQGARLKFRLQAIAMDNLEMERSENETRLRMEEEYDNFWAKVLLPTVGIVVAKMFNRGRQITFDKYEKDIFAFRYTAVLDSRTTDFCRELDGKVFQVNDPDYAMLTPPNHYGCRSFWTPILKIESKGVVVDGRPANVPIYSSVNTFKDMERVEFSDTQDRIYEILGGEPRELPLPLKKSNLHKKQIEVDLDKIMKEFDE